MGCSLADHRQASDPTIRGALDRGPIGLVAAHVLAGGTLTGKYLDHPDQPGRAGMDDSPVARRGREIAAGSPSSARPGVWRRGTSRSAYALAHPNLASIVFGATNPEQVRANVGAVKVFESLDASQRATIDSLAWIT